MHSSTLKIEAKMLTRRAKRRRLEEEDDPGIIPSLHELERKAMVERAKVELMKLKVVDLKKELKLFGNPKIFSRENRKALMPNFPKKVDYVDWLANYKWLLEGSPFDKLPDELVLKIVKMASWEEKKCICKWHNGKGGYDRDFIVDSISHVNLRFNRIAKDTSLWKDASELYYWSD